MNTNGTPQSPYEPQQTPEDELWFLPAHDVDTTDCDLPWPIAEPEHNYAPAWIEAERKNAVWLARAAAAFGALEDRLRQAGEGAYHRIALDQVAGFCWHLEGRLSKEQIALYLATRLSRAGDAMPALARASWAMRRLLDGQGVCRGNLANFLGRSVSVDGKAQPHVNRPQCAEFIAQETLFWSLFSAMQSTHPITQAAFGWNLWQRIGMSGDTARIEGAVVTARIGAEPVIARSKRQVSGFLPFTVAPNMGSVSDRLRRFYTGVENECLAALLTLDQGVAWRDRARGATAHLSGRTPALIIDALANWPMLSADVLEVQTGVSRAAVQRNIDRLQDLGLVHEITGQTRFRMWAAKG